MFEEHLRRILIASVLLGCVAAQTCEVNSKSEQHQSRAAGLIDVTHSMREDLPVWDSFDKGLGKIVKQVQSIANGSLANISEMKMGVHTGTHVDSPSHFLEDKLLAGVDTTNGLDLTALTGPVLVVQIPTQTNITSNVLKQVVPPGVERVLFRTLNTERRLMWKPKFVTDFTALTMDGSEWIASNTGLRLVGNDYLSIGIYDQPAQTHRPLLRKGVVVLEGLNLDEVHPGMYTMHCLPTKLVGSDGSPTRCILIV